MDGKEAAKSWNDIDSDEAIVISGIAGRFPHSDNMDQLRENLFNKIDLVTADHNRWKIEFPKRMGIVNNVEKFDADFFEIPFEQAHTFTSETRLLLEHSYEAVIDAGINPKQLQGKNTAVIIGSSVIEGQKTLFTDIVVRKIILSLSHARTRTHAYTHARTHASMRVLCISTYIYETFHVKPGTIEISPFLIFFLIC
ncbi:Fatty acid synthase [Trachymyrmex zeteki]|uniref:Fatty acid synthase n=1 Tax=Mycetomoellerius zeteki TaxID=64791 RepID=A0A151WQJ9_9HYME|nr:Fatty acid synthase [Trachymyrmex zeteki]